MPSAQNIKALSEHVSIRFQEMLVDYNIPFAPNKITYDNQGKIQVPMDYPYINELNQALKENEGIGRELSTVSALSSHYIERQKQMPFIDEIGQYSSQVEKERVIAKYNHLLDGNPHYAALVLTFDSKGGLHVTADGKPVALS